jgi:3-dehydroquinate synthase
MLTKINVSLESRSYPIYIGDGILTDSNLILTAIHSNQIVIVTDSNVANFHLNAVKQNFSKNECHTFILSPGEESKNFAELERLLSFMLENNVNRNATLIALGGGVVGDLAGFAAASYQRGISYVQMPTTLLAQVDSSVGGKTAINLPLGKNMVGAFYQPQAVFIDTSALKTLPNREFNSGMAEVVKYGLINDADFLDWIGANIPDILAQNSDTLNYLIQRSCENKAKIVSADERERGIRATLNLGHTFGHAIETTLGYGRWLHGEAVAAGIMMALFMSWKLGFLRKEQVKEIKLLLTHFSLPTEAPQQITPEQFIALMTKDKKNIDGSIRLVLLKNFGDAFVTSDYLKEILLETIGKHDY